LRLRDLLDSLPAHPNVGDRRQCGPIGALKSAQIPANPPLAKVRTRIRIIEEKRSMRRQPQGSKFRLPLDARSSGWRFLLLTGVAIALDKDIGRLAIEDEDLKSLWDWIADLE
jgi:hypothetical protein